MWGLTIVSGQTDDGRLAPVVVGFSDGAWAGATGC